MTASAAVFIGGLVLAAILAPLSIRLARRFHVLDLPGPRKAHGEPVPRLGGLAVWGGVVLPAVAFGAPDGPALGLLAGGTLVFLVGAWEDSRGLSPWARLAGQTAGACLAVAAGVRWELPVPGGAAVDAALALVWLVGMSNAVNFVDGIDGLAACLGVLASALFWPFCGERAWVAAGLSGACLGFLPYNWHRARVFLGDGGSTFIGFVLAALGLLAAQGRGAAALPAPLAVMALPLADLLYTTVSRVRRGEVRSVRQWVEYAAADHIHHRLLDRGLSVRKACVLLAAAGFCAGLLGVALTLA